MADGFLLHTEEAPTVSVASVEQARCGVDTLVQPDLTLS
jgi:hypothetical protein